MSETTLAGLLGTLIARLTRYDLVTNYRAGSSIEEMERAEDGEWCRVEQIEELAAALPPAQGWQPIETLPLGQYVLVATASWVAVGQQDRADTDTYWTWHPELVGYRKPGELPTHWMPLPSPPRETP